MSATEAAGAAMTLLDSVMAVVNDIRARLTGIENEDQRRREAREAAKPFHEREDSPHE